MCDPLVTHGPYLSALDMGHDKALYRCTLLYFTSSEDEVYDAQVQVSGV